MHEMFDLIVALNESEPHPKSETFDLRSTLDNICRLIREFIYVTVLSCQSDIRGLGESPELG